MATDTPASHGNIFYASATAKSWRGYDFCGDFRGNFFSTSPLALTSLKDDLYGSKKKKEKVSEVD